METRRYREEEVESRGRMRRRIQSRPREGQENRERRNFGERRRSLQGSSTTRPMVRRGGSEPSDWDTSYREDQRYYTHSRSEFQTESEAEDEELTDTDYQDTSDSQEDTRGMRQRGRRVVARRRTTSQSRRPHSSQTISGSPEYIRAQTRHSSGTREESGTERGRTRRRNFRRGSHRAKQSAEPLANQIALAMHNLGLGANRRHPEPEKFRIESGESFSQFIGDFERYCYHAISDNTEDWRRQLKYYLRGEMLEVYYDVKKGKQSYKDIIQELREYYTQRKRSVKVDHKTEFHQADWREGESVHRYAVRLEGLAREAYGRRFERVLRKKFLETAPENFISLLTVYGCARGRRFGLTIEELDWEEIRSLAAKERRRTKKSFEGGKFKRDRRAGRIEVSDESEEEDMMEARASTATQLPPVGRKKSESPQNIVTNTRDKVGAVKAGQCFRCGNTGHFIAHCPQAPTGCYACGENTHFARDCPNKWRPANQWGRGRGYWQGGVTNQPTSNQMGYPQQGGGNQQYSGYGEWHQNKTQGRGSATPGRGFRGNGQVPNNWGPYSPQGNQGWQPQPQRRGVSRWRGFPQGGRGNVDFGRGSPNIDNQRISGETLEERRQNTSEN